MIKILVVEDDDTLNALVSLYLKGNGYEVISCKNGQEAQKLFKKENIDMIITDIMMSMMDGFELAMEVRKENKDMPIVFMSAKDDMPSKQLGYTIGIDDYIVKPFDIDELVLKVKAILRRSKIISSKKLSVGNLTMNQEEHTAYVDNKELQLTIREFDILFKMLSNPKIIFTRGKLMEEFWDFDSSATSRTVDVYMAKIREKTAICNGFDIVTVHGLGYKAVLK
jgi:response regulator receiver domain protein